MKKLFTFLSIILLAVGAISAQTSNPTLNEMLDLINKDSLRRTVQDMQDFETRLCIQTVGQNRQVAQYLVDRLKVYGIENARIDSFPIEFHLWGVYYAQYMYNVLGTLEGTEATDSTVIIGAHLDAVSLDAPQVLSTTAPGADDNATGCAVMIEMARIIHENNLKPRHNIDFMAYDAEEIGLLGAHYDAGKRRAANEKIIVMINNDMVGHQPEDEIWEVVLHWYDNSLDVTEKAKQALINYTAVAPFVPTAAQNKARENSDSWAYFQKNFRATFAIEKHFNPYYHSTNDIIDHLNFEYCREIARMNFVLLAYYSGIHLPPLSIIQNNTHNNFNINVFPNPANDVIRVHNYNDITIHQIDIYEISGKLKMSLPSPMQQQNIIRLDNFNSGIYFMRIYTDKGIINKKIIKQ
jgi:hypothetical protein